MSYRYSSIDSMKLYAGKAYDIALKTDYIPGLVESSRILAVAMLIKGDYLKVSEFLFEIKLKTENSSLVYERAILDHYLGIAFNTSGNYQAGLPYLLEALEIFRTLENDTYILRSLNNIGVCYIRLGQFQEALQIFKEIESTFQEYDPGTLTTLAVNLAFCHYGLGNYARAKEILLDFLALPDHQVNERGYGFAYFKLGEVYLKQDEIAKAIEAFNFSISTYKKFQSINDMVEPLVGLARVYMHISNYDVADNYADRAVQLAEESGNLNHQKLALKTCYEVCKLRKDYQRALRVHEEYRVVLDSLVATQQTAEMGRITAQYEFSQQKNRLILEQKEEQLENERILNNQKLAIQITIVVIIVIIILMFFIYRSYTLKVKGNRLLKEKNEEILHQRDELDQTNRIKNKLFSIIAHDLRSPINTLDGLLYLVRNKITNNEDLEAVMPKLINSFDHTSDLLNNLLSWATSQMEGYTLELRSFNIKDILVKIIEDSRARLDEKGVLYSVEGEDVHVYAEPDMIQIVCRNLLSNAIKYCQTGDEIKLKIEIEEHVCIKVIDTGAGIPKDKVEVLLSDNTFISTKGTDGEKGSGLGLMICKDLLIKNDSNLEIVSKEGEGSSFSFCLLKAD
ncbi:MAG: tetratricopeptide repeat-containing sensor histidine kinase [Bacteroidota bacterium]